MPEPTPIPATDGPSHKGERALVGKEPPAGFADAGGIPADPDTMTKQEQAEARKQWRTSKCTWCGGLHLRACPRVKKFEFGNDGKTVTSVEYWAPVQWNGENVVWPEDMGWEDDDNSPFEAVDTEAQA